MLKTFEAIKPLIHPTKATIDNFLFKLHYRYTFIILLVATVLVTSRQYIGEHIKCISDTIPPHVVNSFCFIQTTFTVVRHLNNSALDSGALFEPGIGPYHFQEEPIKRHAYYQWVPFVLFGQALCFFVPHFAWKHWEGGRVKDLVIGLKFAALSRYTHHKMKFGKDEVPTMDEIDGRVLDIRREIKCRMRLNSWWGIHLMMAEFMNLCNIMFQIWWTNKFLAGQFYSLGFKVINENWQNKMDILDVVFPKVTKCHFQKFGASGSLQIHDTLCVMALNIINEKIYTILWFWFAFMLLMSMLAVAWRISTLIFFKSKMFSKNVFRLTKAGKIFKEYDLYTVIRQCDFSNWMFLYFLASNLTEFVFKKVLANLAAELSDSDYRYSRRSDDDRFDKPGYSLDTVDGALLPKEA